MRQLAPRIVLALVAPTALTGGPAFAQAEYVEPEVEQAETLARTRPAGDFVLAPIPILNPTLGVGLALGAAYLYTIDEGSQPSLTGAGGLYTDTGSRAFGVAQSAYLRGDAWKISGGAAVFDLELDFYGIGSGSGDDDRFVPVNQQGWGGGVKVLRRIAGNWYGGGSYYYVDIDSAIDLSMLPPDGSIELPPEADAQTSVAGIGIAAEYDTRDNRFAPSRGVRFEAAISNANETVGSDFDFSSFRLSYNHYRSIGDQSVLAVRGAGCSVPGDAPYYGLCKLGVFPDLRGYVAGRYRDETMLAVQAEWRWRFWWKLSTVAFAGAGQVEPSFGDYRFDDLLPSVGVGVRYLLSEDNRLNISVDYAVGRDSEAVYFYVGESF